MEVCSNVIHKDEPDVSVIVPMYNVGDLIADTIISIKKNVCHLEIILINDGSTDNTLEQAEKAVNNDSRFKIINQNNSGVSSARNRGVLESKGEYITFVDSDDLLTDGAIDFLLEMACLKKADYVYGGIKKFNSQKKWSIPLHKKLGVFERGFKTLQKNPELFYSLGPAGKLFSRKLLGNKQFPENIKYAEDQVIFVSVLLAAKVIFSTGKDSYLYRERDINIHGMSAMQQRDHKAFSYLSDMLTVIREIECVNNKSDFSINEINNNLINYYERAIKTDVWPLLIRVLKYQPSKTYAAFELIRELLEEKDAHFISAVPAFRYIFIFILSDNVFYIKGYQSFISYRNLLNILFDGFNSEIYRYFSKPTHYGSRWKDSYFLAKKPLLVSYFKFLGLKPKKRFFCYFNKNKERIIKSYIFPILKILPLKKNKIIFASSKAKPMAINFDIILNTLKKEQKSDKYRIYKFLGSSKKTSTLLLRYFHTATAKTIFLEDYYRPYYGMNLSKDTNVIQLWHACGAFKRFSHDAIGAHDANTKEFEDMAHSSYTHVVTSSENIRKNYSSAFNRDIESIKALGVPRTDVFFNEKKTSDVKIGILKKYPFLINTQNVLYAPTFRGTPIERKIFNLPIEWDQFKKLPSTYRLIIKLHPTVEKITPEIPDWVKDQVMILDSKENVNDWMMFCDALITDYSSLIFEYCLLNKPIIYFPYDMNNYFDERGFYYSYSTYVYGDVVYTTEALIEAIQLADIRMIAFAEKRVVFKNKFMRGCDGNATRRIIHQFIEK